MTCSSFLIQATEPAGTSRDSKSKPEFSRLMASIIRQNQQETGDTEIDTTREAAKKALENYLCLPVLAEKEEGGRDDPSNDTFLFWKNHSRTSDKAQKALCHVARIYLTPPPTSTGMC